LFGFLCLGAEADYEERNHQQDFHRRASWNSRYDLRADCL
jgi:hypothetical protein